MRPLLALSCLLLAGCASGGHEHVGEGALEALVGIRNVGPDVATFGLRVHPAEGEALEMTFEVQAGATVERRFELSHEAEHRVTVTWTAGSAEDVWDAPHCRSYHVIFVVDPREAAERVEDRARECH